MAEFDGNTSALRSIRPAHVRWLRTESALWVQSGLLDTNARARILESYDPAPAAGRGILALILLGVMTAAIGLSLVIGYNWDRISVEARVGGLISAVVLAFAASAAARATKRMFAGDMLGLLGIVLHGASIWLIATLLKMDGYTPDAFQWWAIGAVASALLIQSRIVAIGASIVVATWALATLAAGAYTLPDEGRTLWFAGVMLASVFTAYRTSAAAAIAILVAAVAFWAPALAPEWVGWSMVFGLPAFAGCAAYAIGAHQADSAFRRAWQTTGLVAILIAFVPMLFTDTHHGHFSVQMTPVAAWIGILLIAGISSVVWRVREATLLDVIVIVTAVVIGAWMGFLDAGFSGADDWSNTATAAFSVLAVSIAIALIQKALSSDRLADLVLGVAFAAVFLVIRWVSVIDSMLWSGVMLIGASVGFFVVARLWGSRRSLAAALAAGGR